MMPLPRIRKKPTRSPHTEEKIAGYAATCFANGLTDGIQCSVCENWIKEQTIIKDKGYHTEVVLEAKAATCTATGLEEGLKCSACGEVTHE